MRYILTLFLIALVSSSEIIDKADEIKEFAEYEDVQLEFLFGIIPFIGKAIAAAVGLFAKAKAFIVGTKVFKFVKGAIGIGSKIFKGAKAFVAKGTALVQKSKIFQTGKKIFDAGRQIYNKYKGVIQNTKLYKKVVGTIDKVKQSKIYQTYQKIKDTYNKGKEVYDKVKDYYEKGKDIYNKYFKKDQTQEEQQQAYQEEHKYRTTQYQAQQQRLSSLQEKLRQARLMQQQQANKPVTPVKPVTTVKPVTPVKPVTTVKPVNNQERNQAFIRYGQLRNDKTMTLATKQVAINNHLDYMLKKGFINQVQKQGMSNIQPPKPRK